MSTGIKVQGHIKVTAIDAFGGERVVYDGHNLIMDAGLSSIPLLMAQTVGVPTSYATTILRAGESNVAPANAQVALQGAQVGPDKAFTLVTLDSGGTPGLVDFETSLATTEGNGQTVQEVALFLTNGTMFSRQVIGAVAKTVAITLKFNWRIQFSRI